MSNSSICPIDRTISDATALGQSGPVIDGNEEVLRISQNSRVTGAPPLDCLASYKGTPWGGSYSSAEMQSVYSTTPVDGLDYNLIYILFIHI